MVVIPQVQMPVTRLKSALSKVWKNRGLESAESPYFVLYMYLQPCHPLCWLQRGARFSRANLHVFIYYEQTKRYMYIQKSKN